MGAVREWRGRFEDAGPLHVRCRGLGVVRMGAWQGVDGSGDEPAANGLEDLSVPGDGGQFLCRRGPCWPSSLLCNGVGLVPVRGGVMPPVQGARLEAVPGFVICVATDAFGVACWDVNGAAGYLAYPVTSKRSAGQVISPDGATKDISSQIYPMKSKWPRQLCNQTEHSRMRPNQTSHTEEKTVTKLPQEQKSAPH